LARRALTLWLAFNALALIFAGQVWWQLRIQTGDPSTLVSGSGFDADKSISAILIFGLAAWLFVAFSRGVVALVITCAAATANILLLVVTLMNFAKQNIGGIAATVEKHTGIAINSVLSSNENNLISGELQVWAWLTVVALLLTVLVQLYYVGRFKTWAKQVKTQSDRTKTKQAKTDGNDPISLWDSQRE
jgi:Tryptophan-associated transmembrane protein (Trp_oprn_chp)